MDISSEYWGGEVLTGVVNFKTHRIEGVDNHIGDDGLLTQINSSSPAMTSYTPTFLKPGAPDILSGRLHKSSEQSNSSHSSNPVFSRRGSSEKSKGGKLAVEIEKKQ